MMRTWLKVSPSRAGVLGVLFVSLVLGGCGALLTAHYRIERAQREMKAGQWQAAAFDLRAVLHKNPRNTQAWLLLARVSLDAADASGAASALAHARTAGAKGPAFDVLQARVWLANAQPQALLAALSHHTIDLSPGDAVRFKGQALLASGQASEAGALVRAYLANHPKDTPARDLLAQALVAQGKRSEALQALATAHRDDPNAAEPLLIEGELAASLGQPRNAQNALQAALKRMPASEPLLHRVAALIALTQVQLALGRIDAAARSQKALAGLAPQAPATGLLDARIKLARNDLVGGTVELQQVVANAPHFLPARLALGAAFLQRGDLQQAQQQLQQVVDAAPANLQARELLADVQLKLDQPDAALGVLTPALDAGSLDPQTVSLLGEAAGRSDHAHSVGEALRQTLSQHPHDAAVVDNLAAVYLKAGEADKALALLRQNPDDTDLRRVNLLLTALLNTQGPDAADREADRLAAAHPHQAPVLALAAAYFASRNQLPRAHALLAEALAVDPNNLSLTDALARVEAAEGDTAGATRRLNAALAAHPHVLGLRLALAGTLVQAHEFAQARKVLLGAPDAKASPQVQFALARVALVAGDLAEANTAFDHAIAARPHHPALVEDAGLLLMQAHQYAPALDRFTQATQAEPKNAAYWLERARAELALSHLDAARASLRQAGSLRRNWLPVVSLQALIDVRRGEGSAALSRVGGLLATEPHDAAVLALKGDVESALHHPHAALSAYRAALRLQPSAALAVKLYQAGLDAHVAQPAKPLQAWLKREPANWRVRDVLADYELTVAHAPKRAEQQLRTVLRLAPNDVNALNNLAWILRRAPGPEAESLARRAYQQAPALASVNDTLGWILANKGQSSQALAYLAHAVKLAPRDPQMAYHYAFALARAGRHGQARRILAKILSDSKPFDARARAQLLLKNLGGGGRS